MTAPTVGSQRPGGRTSRTRHAVLDATRQLLTEQGPSAMRIDLIARTSGVNRSSIYRRWRNPAGIVTDLASDITTHLRQPDTGSLHGDLEAMAHQLAHQLAGDGAALIRALAAWPDPDVQTALATFWADRRTDMSILLQKHSSTADPAAALRLLAGPLHYQAITERSPITDDTIHHAVTATAALATT